jgi:hypothetical protein
MRETPGLFVAAAFKRCFFFFFFFDFIIFVSYPVNMIPTGDVIEDILLERRKRNRARYNEYFANTHLK